MAEARPGVIAGWQDLSSALQVFVVLVAYFATTGGWVRDDTTEEEGDVD